MQTREQVIEGLNGIHAVDWGMGNDACYLNSIGIKQLQTLLNDATALLRSQEPRVMTLDEAQSIRDCGTLVWLETSGGYEGTRYKAIPAIVSDNTHGILPEDAMHFYNTAGRAWNSYNRDICGWRLWTAEPTDEQREATPWERLN